MPLRMLRNFRGCGPPRRRNNIFLIILISVLSTIFILYSLSASQYPREEKMEQNIVKLQTRLQFLESLYLARSEDILKIQNKVFPRNNRTYTAVKPTERHDQITAEIVMILKNMTGMKSSAGVHTKNVPAMQNSFILKLLPHLANNPGTLRPSYHLKSNRHSSDIVIAIPTVKRDKQSYLMITLEHLISGLQEKDKNDTLIVVLVGETDLEYVLTLARDIEIEFEKEVETGMIEVISPSATYYPDLDDLPLTLGDSLKRVKWRTKQNLDTIYLMAYAQTRGTYYLMLEDDVIAKENYVQEIKQFVSATTITTPDWFILEFCHVGGIGKLFKSSDLINFIVYVQLFYKNMPIDWLVESYLADRVCTIDKYSNACGKNKMQI
nr:alpha-1,3-mannosyl-glycoprotein 4-beta-N-acetylglucosaminyltransferase A [Vanessa tameamea]